MGCLDLTQSRRLARGHRETYAIDRSGRFGPDICTRQRNQIFISALSGEPNMGSIMWISVWAVTIALAIGFSVMAVAMQSENDQAALGR